MEVTSDPCGLKRLPEWLIFTPSFFCLNNGYKNAKDM